ncbi:MAG TPA: outer membrane beta-barrel protein [Sphingopyxis sp.]|nr:outer membrane beta-barrel protein [Sphingopyxis sp.]
MLKTTVATLVLATAALATSANAQEGRWQGPYIGAHGAYGDGKVQDVDNASAAKQDIDGWLGGIQAGYNRQNGNFVYGIEADVTFGKNEKKWLDRDTFANRYSAYYGRDSIRTSGTLRARAGYGGEKALVYLTGGLAIADTKHGIGCDGALNTAAIGRCSTLNANSAFYNEASKTRIGYVLGGGVEVAVNDNISIKGEYNYVDYGKKTVNIDDPLWNTDPNFTGDRNFDLSTNLYKVGVNFRF